MPPPRPVLRLVPIAGVATIEVPPQREHEGLAGLYYSYLDPTGELTWEQVRAASFQDRFRLAESDAVNLGFTSAVLWLRFDFSLHGAPGPVWLLTFDYPLLDSVEIYDAASEASVPFVRLGDLLPFSHRMVPSRSFALPLAGFTDQHRRLYVRIQTESSMQVHPALVNGETLFLENGRRELVFGLGYGVMLLMAIYNLFLYFEIRDKTYLAYVFSTLFGLGFLMALNGHAFQYLWPQSPLLANLANPAFASLWLLSTAWFAWFFLEPRQHSRSVAAIILGFIVLGTVATITSFVASYRPAMVLASGSSVALGILLLLCGAVVWWKGQRAARFFTLAWAGLGAGTTTLALSRFGLFPDNEWTRHGALAGAIAEIVLLSLAISDKYRLMHVQLQGYSKGLEAMVEQRTRQLEAANLALQELSATDPLTGVANRRRFDGQLDTEVNRHRRSSMPLSLAMIDIDQFKAFNDRFGHQAGDACLTAVAQAISSAAHRPADLVARYGGEEFVVLLPQTDELGAQRIAQRMLEAMHGLDLAAAAPAADQRVTVSIGLTTQTPADGDGPEQLVEAADRALYEAKRQGRDRIVTAGTPPPPAEPPQDTL